MFEIYGLFVYCILAFLTKRGLCDQECWEACSGSFYTGTLSVTVNGKTCQSWASQSPHTHNFDRDEYFTGDDSLYSASNYCRDPQGIGQPGCYTTDPLVPYEFCDVPICDYTCCYDEHNLSQFIGTTSVTYKGRACLDWVDQTFPFNFNNDSLFPADTSVTLSRNYCRDPDDSGQLWCYVEDDDSTYGRRRQKCAIPKCHPYSIYCGGILRGGQGWISPVFLDSGQWVVCHWTLFADDGYSVTIQVMEIFDGEDENGQFIFTLCGFEKDLDNVTSSTNSMFIIFKGIDKMTTEYRTLSFNISYSQIEDPGYCDEYITMTAGLLASQDSNRDGVYENNLDCWYNIVADEGLVVQLAVLDLDMGGRTSDIDDIDSDICFPGHNLQIFAGDDEGEYSNFIGQYCALPPPPMITTRNNKLLVIFSTAQWWASDGFFALYSATINRTEYFYGILNDINGLVTVNSRYLMYSEWTITAKEDHVLQLHTITMNFIADKNQHCNQTESLQIFDGTNEKGSLIGTYCGKIPPSTITPKSHTLTLVYVTYYISEEAATTFLAWYRAFPRMNATLKHEWPPGEYSLPMTAYGCNDPESKQWSHSYINITFKQPVVISNRINGKSSSLLAGPYGARSYQMNFCTKLGVATAYGNETIGWWPPGDFLVYGTDKGCPLGLIPLNVSKLLPEILHLNTDGHIPQIVFHSMGVRSRADFLLCFKSSDMDIANKAFDGIFPFAVLSANDVAQWEIHEKTNNSDFITEYISFTSNDDQGQETDFQWFTFDIYLTERLNDQYRVKAGVSPQYKPWELGQADESFLHELTDADYPPYGHGWSEHSRARQTEWLLYDLGQSVSLNALRFVKMDSHAYINGLYAAVPEILVSEAKWSFLYNGAILCLQSIYRLKHMIEVTCLNGQPASAGRYMTLMLRRPPFVNILQRVMSWQWKIQINRAEKSERCNQFLGMTDNSIGDFQITSSSSQINYPAKNSRPFSSGWCANKHDHNPFVQVDLLYPAQIEGVYIFNWWDVGGSGNISKLGVYQFSIDIDLDESLAHSSTKTKVFNVDLSLPLENAQTFIFVTPVIGQYVRIYPLLGVDSADFRCLKFEIIGCLYTERITTQCSGKETYKWIETSSLYVPESNTQQHVLQSIPSALACITACEDRHRYCTAIMYDETNNECLWYEEPELLTYQRIRVSAPKLGLSKFCFPDAVKKTTVATLYLSQDRNWIEHTTNLDNDAILVNLGYPLHYLKGYVWSWEIVRNVGNVANVIVTDIDFNIYESCYYTKYFEPMPTRPAAKSTSSTPPSV